MNSISLVSTVIGWSFILYWWLSFRETFTDVMTFKDKDALSLAIITWLYIALVVYQTIALF